MTGWKQTRLGSEITLSYGKGLSTKARKGGDVPVYGSNGIVGWHNEHAVSGPGTIIGRWCSSVLRY